MKINGRGGHTEKSIGARDVLDELTEDRKIFIRVKQLLIEVGNDFTDCTPPESMAYPSELNYGVNKCNSTRADVFFSIHLNSAKGAKGSEACIYPGTQLTTDMGNRVLNNLANLGFINRGIKPRSDLYELYGTNCPAMIIEVCFVQEPDATLYKNVGVEKIARAIANGIDSRVSLNGLSESKPTLPPTQSKKKIDSFIKVDGYSWVKNLNDYAGVFGVPVKNFYAYSSEGEILFRVSPVNRDYYPWVQNYRTSTGYYDFAGNGVPIDRVQMKLRGLSGYRIKYRVHLLNGDWLQWVYDDTDYAGIRGKAIDAIEVEIV